MRTMAARTQYCSSQCRWVLLLRLLRRLLLLSARVLVTAWPCRARVCLVLVLLEQSNDRGLGSHFFRCNSIENLLRLVRSSAARAVRSSTKAATTGVRVLLELSVARVLLQLLLLFSPRVLVTA